MSRTPSRVHPRPASSVGDRPKPRPHADLSPPLSLAERIFLRLCCVPPPEVPFEPSDSYDPANPPPMDADPLSRARRVFGERFESAIRGVVFLDIGCGPGHQVLAAAQAGATLSVGIDTAEISLKLAETHAQRLGLTDRVRFTADTISTFGAEWADVALSQNSFEHFEDPGAILAQAYAALKPGGQFFVTFGPTWWHPFGAHHMFMIRMPWAHRFFSMRTILRLRQLYRPNSPTTWPEVSLNQMTISKLLTLVALSGFTLASLSVTPIRRLPHWLVQLKLFREWTTSDVSVVLTKPRG